MSNDGLRFDPARRQGFESPYTAQDDESNDYIIITSSNKTMKKRRRFTREEVLEAAKRNLQRYIDGDHTVKVYL